MMLSIEELAAEILYQHKVASEAKVAAERAMEELLDRIDGERDTPLLCVHNGQHLVVEYYTAWPTGLGSLKVCEVKPSSLLAQRVEE